MAKMSLNFSPSSLDLCLATKFIRSVLYQPFLQKFTYSTCLFTSHQQPKHLICFKQWTAQMVIDIILSAMNLKCRIGDSHNKKLDIIPNAKVMIMQESNEPMLNMAVSKAATLLGAADVRVTDEVVWNHDYNGRIFSDMADVIFVNTKTQLCIQRFANMSTVPVLCMMSRTHASIQSLATIMAIMEEYGTMEGINVAYVGKPHPILNSYLLLCPMLGANIRFKCCCKECAVSPLLYKDSKKMTTLTSTSTKQCSTRDDALSKACVIIAGPTTKNKEMVLDFVLTGPVISRLTCYRWIFFHTCPRGQEVDDTLFWSFNSRTFHAMQNMHYIAAALMADCIRDYKF